MRRHGGYPIFLIIKIVVGLIAITLVALALTGHGDAVLDLMLGTIGSAGQAISNSVDQMMSSFELV